MRPAAPARATWAIVAVSVAAYVLARLLYPADLIAEQAGVVPIRFVGAATGFVIPLALTPLTATLAHGDLIHLGFNMLMLVWCGRMVESVYGAGLTLTLYIVGAYLAAAAQVLIDPVSPVPMIGASGAISALVATYALLFGRDSVRAIGPIPAHWVRAAWLAVAWTGIQWLVGVATSGGSYQIATAAHVGGFLAGLALTRPLLLWRYRGA